MADDEDFTCEKFQPQKWRRDVCRNCYQPIKMHKSSSPRGTSPRSPLSPGAGDKEAKVFQRFRSNKETAVDRPVPALHQSRDKQDGVGAKATTNQVNPTPSPPPTSTTPSVASKSPTPVVSTATDSHILPVVRATTPVGVSGGASRSSSVGVKVPSRPPPPASVIAKPPPPATVGTTTHRPLETKLSSPRPSGTTSLVQQVARQPEQGPNTTDSNKSSQENSPQMLTDKTFDSHTAKEFDSRAKSDTNTQSTPPNTLGESGRDWPVGVVPKYPEGGISTGEQVEEVVEVVVISESPGELENSFQHMEEGGGGGGGGGGGEGMNHQFLMKKERRRVWKGLASGCGS